jgi:hypothetical protein
MHMRRQLNPPREMAKDCQPQQSMLWQLPAATHIAEATLHITHGCRL